MDFVEVSRSLLVVPSKYENVQPHHLAIGYAFYRLLASSSIVQKASKFLLNVLSNSTESFIPMVKMGLVPDFLIRFGIRVQLYNHLNVLAADNVETELKNKTEIVHKLKTMPIAIATDEANEQHYEVPAKFYDLCLGPRKKYSSGLWPNKDTTFEESEVAMLEHYCQLAGVEDGMSIVDLGCGWGSLTLHLAERYPNAKITGISNSHSQREYILNTAKERGYNVGNITIVTCNVSDDKGALDVVKGNDRVMTVEMFEHMKNYDHLMEKVNGFLKPGGKLFVHIFTHKDYTYHFDKGWMSDNFFTGGTMPSDDLLLYFANHFKIENHWRVNGTNYEKTSNGWLDYLDKSWKSGELKPVLAQAYGEGNEREWYVNWRLFFLACAELWGLENGNEWIVSLYLFERR
uniref:Polyketide synthase methyltransferase domain-containing protein n=1 Tax=Entomoneis paludosa TaxID=265537 RepID=A0A7S3DNC6_9STRA|mmetsp:Transcript_22765/g.47501  ORF Transcript_22765/g.47501 Transcript_22765/m.47501 type:complete len:403 (+) Transcript_22765:125-1333(+)